MLGTVSVWTDRSIFANRASRGIVCIVATGITVLGCSQCFVRKRWRALLSGNGASRETRQLAEAVQRCVSSIENHVDIVLRKKARSSVASINPPHFIDEILQRETRGEDQIDLSTRLRAEKVDLTPELSKLARGFEQMRGHLGDLFVRRVANKLLTQKHRAGAHVCHRPGQSLGHAGDRFRSLFRLIGKLVSALAPRYPDCNSDAGGSCKSLCPRRPCAPDRRWNAGPLRAEEPANRRLHPHPPERSSLEPGNYP